MPRARRPLKVISTREWTVQDDLWQEQARRWETEALPTLRQAADRWAAGLAVLLGGSGIGVLLGGPGELTTLTHRYESWGKALLFAAGCSATFALLMALLAAGTTTKTLFLLSGTSLRQANRAAVKTAARQLRISRWATLAALVLLLAVAALLFFGPQDP